MEINEYDVEETVGENGITLYSYFACTCDGEDADFWKEGLKNHLPSEVENAPDPVSALVMELTHCYNATVTGIGCDMWFGISISAGYGSWQGDSFVYAKECEMFIQCDEISHGLLAAIMILKEKGYDKNESN